MTVERVVRHSLMATEVEVFDASLAVREGSMMRWVSLGLGLGFLAAGLSVAAESTRAHPVALVAPIPGALLLWVSWAGWRWRVRIDGSGWRVGVPARFGTSATVVVPWADLGRVVIFRGEHRPTIVVMAGGKRGHLSLPTNGRASIQEVQRSEDVFLREAHHLAHRLGQRPVPVEVDLRPRRPAADSTAPDKTGFWTGCSRCEPVGT